MHIQLNWSKSQFYQLNWFISYSILFYPAHSAINCDDFWQYWCYGLNFYDYNSKISKRNLYSKWNVQITQERNNSEYEISNICKIINISKTGYDSPNTQMCYCNHSYHREWTRTPSLLLLHSLPTTKLWSDQTTTQSYNFLYQIRCSNKNCVYTNLTEQLPTSRQVTKHWFVQNESNKQASYTEENC